MAAILFLVAVVAAWAPARRVSEARGSPDAMEAILGVMRRCVWTLLCFTGYLAAQPDPAGQLAALHFLLGEWTGSGQGQPGNATGGFVLAKDLDGKILTRRSRAEYPATKDQPARVHSDFTVVFPTPGGLCASYFDNEGNVINYRVEAAPEQGAVTFLSDPEPGKPRFRLIYRKEENRVRVIFEIAPPGQPEAFRTYTEGVVARSTAGK